MTRAMSTVNLFYVTHRAEMSMGYGQTALRKLGFCGGVCSECGFLGWYSVLSHQ